MRRRHSALAIALGAFITAALLVVGAMIESPGLPGHALFAGADKVLRLSDPAAKTVATVPIPKAGHHAKARKVTVGARAVAKHAAHRTAAAKPRPAARGNVGSSIGSSRSLSSTAPQAAAPAPAAAATPAPARSAPVATKPAPPVAKAAKADIKVASASVASDGNVHVTLAVAQAASATAKVPAQLAVDMKVGSLPRAATAATGPIALDTALDLVPDPSDPSGARLRMRMQLAAQSSAAPVAPAEDPDSLSNVVTVRLNVPTPPPPRGHTPKSTPTPAPTDPAPSDPAPADPAPVEVQLPIAPADAPADPASQTVQLPVPPAADGSGSDATTPAVPVDVSVTPVDPAPAADPAATPTPTPPPTDG
jgi:ribonuclease E